jgi:hypothetical protein
MQALDFKNRLKDKDGEDCDSFFDMINIYRAENGFRVVAVNDMEADIDYVYRVNRDEKEMIKHLIDILGMTGKVNIK